MQEQQAVAPTSTAAPVAAPKTPGKKSPVDTEINGVIVANMGKPKGAVNKALMDLAKKKQGTATPEDIKRIAAAASDQ